MSINTLTQNEQELLQKIPVSEVRKFLKMQSNYRNIFTDLSHFNSDLNKFISDKCKRNHVTNDMDCVQFRKYKKFNKVRIIEYKHTTEDNPNHQLTDEEKTKRRLQKELLKELSKKFKNVYYIVGDPPFDSLRIRIVRTNNTFILDNENVNRWLEFRIPRCITVITPYQDYKIIGIPEVKKKLRQLHSVKL